MLGKIENRVFVVVYTLRADRIRIISARKANISARKANVREVRRYGNHAGKA
ncbi:BrnT family toxin [Skermanella sp. TT6]|uniref:BrnT family toxin n=1 Tax=Skermanella cutis TaxID=2775420 RepID=UPI00353014C1